MKSNPVTSLLLVVLFVNAVFTALMTFNYVQSIRTLQTLQIQRAAMSRELNVFNSLVTETLEYSKRNPAIEPVLQSIGVKTSRAANPAQPTGKR